MPPDTKNGQVQRVASNYMKYRTLGFFHVMKKEGCDPDYVVSWESISLEVDGINVELPNMSKFLAWSKFLLPVESKGKRTLYKLPTLKFCFREPTNYNYWKISNCHSINFCYGEDSTGKMVKHPGVWFTRDDFSQAVPHEILCRKPAVMEAKKWRKDQESDGWLVRPWQKQLIMNELEFLKQKDLHELGNCMSREKGDFDRRYLYPDVRWKRSDDAESEYLL